MTTYGLRPTLLHTPGERLLRGKGVGPAVGAGAAEDWIALDAGVWSGTAGAMRGRRSHCRIRVGFHWFDKREIADWDRAPYWRETGPGAPSWSLPPTESEVALCLGHADARVRAAALARAESGALPASVLPLVLIRCADTDERVRDLARAALERALPGADEAVLRRLAPLAALVGMRRYGAWVRKAVLGRLGGLPEEAVAHLLAGGAREARIAGLRAGAAYGRLGMTRAWEIAEGDPDNGVRVHALRTVMRLALASGRQTVLDDTRTRVLARLDADRSYEVRRVTFAAAVEAGFFRARDLARLAVGHRDRHIRRSSCAAVLAGPDGNASLDHLLRARDTAVRSAAVGRLRGAGRGDELARHLTDPSATVRAAVCRELRAAGDDPRAHYRALCADPAAVAPAALVGLAEQRCPEDAALLRPLTRHPRAAVRARALSALRMLGAPADDAPPPSASAPGPGARAGSGSGGVP
ncbi:hypothetical protein [Streptomyces sp. NPDC000931]|uniref:hypothetical protein n=1 Tax=Streptomyces sp. NPDC000931 TaxID=3154372 RepID=UPI00331AAE85